MCMYMSNHVNKLQRPLASVCTSPSSPSASAIAPAKLDDAGAEGYTTKSIPLKVSRGARWSNRNQEKEEVSLVTQLST